MTLNLFPGDHSVDLVPNSETYHMSYSALVEVWPCDRDLELVFGMDAQISEVLRGPLYCPYSNVPCKTVTPRDILQLPPYGAHLVLVARKHLLLSTVLQRFASQISSDITHIGHTIERLLHAAATLVTTKDELVQSVEGVECIALESMIHNYAGNLHRALLSSRKAMTLAQLLGLHRKTLPQWPKVIESQTRTRIDFDYIWFRLVETDRYLSLMLGVPQAWPDNDFLEKKQLELCSPLEKLERILLIAGGRILDRNEKDIQDHIITQEIDQLLQFASHCMPPQWWVMTNLSAQDMKSMKRSMSQVTHNFLLMQLHFPYLLRHSDRELYTYSKITVANACRELLARYLAVKIDGTITTYCRGVDFIAFWASAALCLVHMAGICGRQTFFDEQVGSEGLNYLTHQRVSDLGLVEQTIQQMEQTTRDDPNAPRLVALLRPLLVMEGASRNGAMFIVDFTAEADGQGSEHTGQVTDCGDTLEIFIPHCGKVRVASTSVNVDSLSCFDAQFDINVECVDSSWVSEATSANNPLSTGCAAT